MLLFGKNFCHPLSRQSTIDLGKTQEVAYLTSLQKCLHYKIEVKSNNACFWFGGEEKKEISLSFL